ncbi:hypothetical protein ScPMuIL_018698 [Solemya velum]
MSNMYLRQTQMTQKRLWMAQQFFTAVFIISTVLFFIHNIGPQESLSPQPPIHSGLAPQYVSVSYWGRLGNHMFEYATMIGFAERHNKTPISIQGTDLWSAFKCPILRGSSKSLGMYQIYTEKLPAAYSKSLEEYFPFDSFLKGYFQSFRYFDFIKEKLVNNHFKFHDNIQETAEKYINNVVREKNMSNPKVVGIHVRRGDFVRQKRKGYTVAPVPYYYRAMHYFRTKYRNVLFIICSNDVIWSRDNLDNSEDVHYSENIDGNLDLALLANSHHVVITAGSFSWWAGYLSKGEVIYFKGFPQDNTVIGNMTEKTDYYPPYWIGM